MFYIRLTVEIKMEIVLCLRSSLTKSHLKSLQPCKVGIAIVILQRRKLTCLSLRQLSDCLWSRSLRQVCQSQDFNWGLKLLDFTINLLNDVFYVLFSIFGVFFRSKFKNYFLPECFLWLTLTDVYILKPFYKYKNRVLNTGVWNFSHK